ncbi:MAG: molybdenum cofactor biosynthesis protein MoaE, partial [Candidatus Eremiobacteraeota bacterium]|nr:molybdenum cofactor biosynthesis protein MoaE [Candidatus Eremiobacteraeota bacterium]
NRQVSELWYEAYEKLVLAQMEEIVAQTRDSFGDCAIAIVHRMGTIAPGETSVAIAVATPHRREAFLACEFAIDALKERAAIWKKEHFTDERGSVWRENRGAFEAGR